MSIFLDMIEEIMEVFMVDLPSMKFFLIILS